MGKLVDLDAVLGIDMSARAKAKVMKLPATSAITYATENEWLYEEKDEIRKTNEYHDLACVMLCAWRYCSNRHFTQALTRGNMDKIILQNINLMPLDFLRQIISDIEGQYNWWEAIKGNEKLPLGSADPHYLDDFLTKIREEYEKRKNEIY